MECVNCGIPTDFTVRNPLCERCFIDLICQDAAKEACEFTECEFYTECQENND